MFDKIFSWTRKNEEQPAIAFGRYSDNNKTPEKIARWTDADNAYKEKRYAESLQAFFDYLRDDAAGNVRLFAEPSQTRFELYQGSKIVRGQWNDTKFEAEVSIALMPQPSTPVMRRLLEQNFALYYSRYALDGERLCMRFDTDVRTASPNKLYYSLKELATKADKQDDLLVQEFASLQSLDSDHVKSMPVAEQEMKYHWLQRFIQETLDQVWGLDKDKFSGGIAYLLLALAYRIDFLITPEGKLLNEMEKIVGIYFAKDEKPTQEKNELMIEGYTKILTKTKEEITNCLFRSTSTFAIVAPQEYTAISDALNSAVQNMAWYKDNNYEWIANKIIEYGISFCQYSYSLPRPLTELVLLFMQVNYPEYFQSLGFRLSFYDAPMNRFNRDAIEDRVISVLAEWKKKYPLLAFRFGSLKWENLSSFNQSFITELQTLNFNSK